MYFIAHHTDIDCWNKRGHKGYLFIIGDEMAYPSVNRGQIRDHIGDGLQADISTAEIVRELKQRYHVFYILPKNASYGGDKNILGFWRKLLGQNVLELEDPEAVCETIALTIGMMEGTTDLYQGADDLREFGTADRMLQVVTTALAGIPASVTRVKAQGKLLPGLHADTSDSARVRRI
jgi:hypothetical protein